VQAPRSHRALVEEGKGCLNANPFLENPEPHSQTAAAQPLSIAEVDAAGKLLRALPARRSSRSFVGSADTEACAVLRTAYRSQRRELEGDRSYGACQLRPAYALEWGPHLTFGREPTTQISGCSTAIGHTPTPGGRARKPNFCAGLLVAPQLQRWAVITHSVPIMPPALQLLRRLLTR
jgi:hypothetical protein